MHGWARMGRKQEHCGLQHEGSGNSTNRLGPTFRDMDLWSMLCSFMSSSFSTVSWLFCGVSKQGCRANLGSGPVRELL